MEAVQETVRASIEARREELEAIRKRKDVMKEFSAQLEIDKFAQFFTASSSEPIDCSDLKREAAKYQERIGRLEMEFAEAEAAEKAEREESAAQSRIMVDLENKSMLLNKFITTATKKIERKLADVDEQLHKEKAKPLPAIY